MASVGVVKQAVNDVARSASDGKWAQAQAGLEYLAGSWARARMEGRGTKEILAALDRTRLGIVTTHDVPQEVGPAQLAWMIEGARLVLSQAAAPAPIIAGDTRALILEALHVDGDFVSTGEIAHRVARDDASVSRELPDLRVEGLVETRSAGRRKLNRITDAGRAANEELRRARELVRTPGAVVTIERHREVEPPTVSVEAVLAAGAEVRVNGVEQVRRLELADER